MADSTKVLFQGAHLVGIERILFSKNENTNIAGKKKPALASKLLVLLGESPPKVSTFKSAWEWEWGGELNIVSNCICFLLLLEQMTTNLVA